MGNCKNEFDKPFFKHYKFSEPGTGNVRQRVHFKYAAPCEDSMNFYEKTLDVLAVKVQKEAGCSGREVKLGICKSARSKLSLNCQQQVTLEVIVTVSTCFCLDNLYN